MSQPPHQGGEHESQQTRQSERYQQIATEIERGNEQRGDDHAGGAVDHR